MSKQDQHTRHAVRCTANSRQHRRPHCASPAGSVAIGWPPSGDIEPTINRKISLKETIPLTLSVSSTHTIRRTPCVTITSCAPPRQSLQCCALQSCEGNSRRLRGTLVDGKHAYHYHGQCVDVWPAPIHEPALCARNLADVSSPSWPTGAASTQEVMALMAPSTP